jgi:sulfite exporter TauE/SafE
MYLSAVLIGLVGSLHCIAMCSSVTLLIGGQKRTGRYVIQRILYNVGRLLGYGLLGVLAGLFGRVAWFFGVQQWLTISFGVILLAGLILYGSKSIHNPTWKPFIRLTTWLKIGFSKVYQFEHAMKGLFIGVLNGFLPCGLVYMALLGSMSMPSLAGSIFYMMVFGLGTWPMMLAVSFFGGWVKSKMNLQTLKIVPYVIALLFILRGLDLGIPYLSPKINLTNADQPISNCISDPE